MGGKRYEGFDLYNALENIGVNVAPMRLLVEELQDLTDNDVIRYTRAHENGLIYMPRTDGHAVYLKAQLLLYIIREIEKLLKAFDINPA